MIKRKSITLWHVQCLFIFFFKQNQWFDIFVKMVTNSKIIFFFIGYPVLYIWYFVIAFWKKIYKSWMIHHNVLTWFNMWVNQDLKKLGAYLIKVICRITPVISFLFVFEYLYFLNCKIILKYYLLLSIKFFFLIYLRFIENYFLFYLNLHLTLPTQVYCVK